MRTIPKTISFLIENGCLMIVGRRRTLAFALHRTT